MKRAVWLIPALVTLSPLASTGQQTSTLLSVAEAQDLLNADRTSELGVVQVRNLTASPLRTLPTIEE